jgi:hypothetical protein
MPYFTLLRKSSLASKTNDTEKPKRRFKSFSDVLGVSLRNIYGKHLKTKSASHEFVHQEGPAEVLSEDNRNKNCVPLKKKSLSVESFKMVKDEVIAENTIPITVPTVVIQDSPPPAPKRVPKKLKQERSGSSSWFSLTSEDDPCAGLKDPSELEKLEVKQKPAKKKFAPDFSEKRKLWFANTNVVIDHKSGVKDENGEVSSSSESEKDFPSPIPFAQRTSRKDSVAPFGQMGRSQGRSKSPLPAES